ncbi:MAG: rhodanese-like domain-containing protein [Chloroflexi bacterium]|nr:rhodanese-like domain-containing protein [Chloroflexota bacterium]
MNLPWWFPFGRVDEIAPRDLYAQLKNDDAHLQLLDVRTHAEFGAGHIARAKSVPIHELPKMLDALGFDPNKPVIAICLSGHRSIPAYRLLKRAGYREVYSLAGGMTAWWRARLPVSKERAR